MLCYATRSAHCCATRPSTQPATHSAGLVKIKKSKRDSTSKICVSVIGLVLCPTVPSVCSILSFCYLSLSFCRSWRQDTQDWVRFAFPLFLSSSFPFSFSLSLLPYVIKSPPAPHEVPTCRFSDLITHTKLCSRDAKARGGVSWRVDFLLAALGSIG
jgi:hypothetical protein